jgi:anti-sigma regulatory factor (Ser/Thr protein kinase)
MHRCGRRRWSERLPQATLNGMKTDLTETGGPSAPPHQLSVLLSPTRRGARLARLLTVAHLASWGLSSPRAEQVVAELAANAVLHGRVPGRDFRLTLTVTDGTRLRVEVTDTRGEALPSSGRVPPRDDAESGRGLLLVEALSEAWGVDVGPPPRKSVWAELDAH